MSKETCVWHEEYEGPWETACGNAFHISEGTPSENEMAFCCFCGKPIEEQGFDGDLE